jgi:hypothetical protein
MPDVPPARPVYASEEGRLQDDSQDARLKELERKVSDMDQRFDTLQTRLWKRLLFRLDGWPGQNDLNADRPSWRPWRRWWRS